MTPSTRASATTRMANSTCVLRGEVALSEDQMRDAAPSIFADVKHASRSERYTCIPTIEVLRGLRREGFEPFMVAQGRCRIEGKAAYTRHMVRLRHARDIGSNVRPEVSEIVLINSHDGASSYRMLAGVFRFVCCNDLVVGGVTQDIRVPHKGHVHSEVIEAAVAVLADFEAVDASTEAMKAIELKPEEERLFANSALMLRYGERGEGRTPAPITIEQFESPRESRRLLRLRMEPR